MMRKKLLLALAALLVASWIFAAEPPLERRLTPQELSALAERAAKGDKPLTDQELELLLKYSHTEEVDVSLVMVPAVVVDRRGRTVPGLTQQDFHIFDVDQERPISWFSEEMNRPFRVALLLDVSESMGVDSIRERLEQAAIPLGREVGLVDRIMLFTFSDQGVHQLTGWSDRPMAVIREALAAPSHGQTAIVDAISAAAKQFPVTPKERQAIVLITDGMDNASELTPEMAVAAARDVDIPVYVLMLGGLDRQIQSRRYQGSPLRALLDIAEQTGGRGYLISNPEEAVAAASQIRDDLRHQYWLAFRPAKAPDGRFRQIAVKVDKWGARVRTRMGYR